MDAPTSPDAVSAHRRLPDRLCHSPHLSLPALKATSPLAIRSVVRGMLPVPPLAPPSSPYRTCGPSVEHSILDHRVPSRLEYSKTSAGRSRRRITTATRGMFNPTTRAGGH